MSKRAEDAAARVYDSINHERPASLTSEEIGRRTARRLFASRGDGSEVHLREDELSAICEAVADIARRAS